MIYVNKYNAEQVIHRITISHIIVIHRYIHRSIIYSEIIKNSHMNY